MPVVSMAAKREDVLLAKRKSWITIGMTKQTFIRNQNASDRVELFLVSAVSSLLLLRFILSLAGYPQIGGGGLHISHMLWGGLLMLVAILMNFLFIGWRVQRLSALIGGAGFGIFIDELGKFITSDNNYFFHPTVAIIYAIFVALFLSLRTFTRQRPLQPEEAIVNALVDMQEIAISDFDKNERTRTQALLAQASPDNKLARQLSALVATVPIEHTVTSVDSARHRAALLYRRVLAKRYSHLVIECFFGLQVLVALAFMVQATIHGSTNIIHVFDRRNTSLSFAIIGQGLSALVAAYFVIRGIIQLRGSAQAAYGSFQQAALVQILIGSFCTFYQSQFRALPSFIYYLALYIIARFLQRVDR
jgi:hypothetical protein